MKTRPNDTRESVSSRRSAGRGYALLAALWLPLQAGGSAAPAPAEPQAAEPPNGPQVSPWSDSAVAGLREIRRLATEERYDEARALARGILVPHGLARVREDLDDTRVGGVLLKPVDPVLERLGWNGPPERTRAEVSYADGVVAALAGDGDAALESFERAASLAGPGSLRLESLYDRGTVLLAGAESLRAQIPELQDPAAALAPTAPPPGSPGTPGADDEEPPDFLKLARRAYEAARAAFVERLRADWRDEDTRANLELIQRRLRELDEIEEQRQEQQEEQQQGEEGDEQQEGEEGEEREQEGEEGEEQGEGEEGEDGQGDGEDGEGPREDPDESPDPSEEESPAESEEEREPEESEEDVAESEEESTDEAEESETSAEEAQPAEEEERVLTREEVVRLLDRLREIDEQAEALRARLRQRGRVAVEKDW